LSAVLIQRSRFWLIPYSAL